MAKSSIMIDLDDPRTDKIASAISNKTSKKILALLSEKEMSETDIAIALNLPLNTVDYNIKILVESGLIEKASKYFWSRKGKKIVMYKVSNKRIVISPRRMIKGIIPAVIISGMIALGIRFLGFSEKVSEQVPVTLQEEAAKTVGIAQPVSDAVVSASVFSSAWLWFLTGALTGLLIFLLWNYLKNNLLR